MIKFAFCDIVSYNNVKFRSTSLVLQTLKATLINVWLKWVKIAEITYKILIFKYFYKNY